MKAFCYRCGEIGFGRTVPEGALHLMTGPAKLVRKRVEARARHAYRHAYSVGVLLVPGIPEAVNDDQLYEAYSRFCEFLNRAPKAQQVAA